MHDHLNVKKVPTKLMSFKLVLLFSCFLTYPLLTKSTSLILLHLTNLILRYKLKFSPRLSIKPGKYLGSVGRCP